MIIPEFIELELESLDGKDLSDIIVEMKVETGRKNPYYIYFPKTDSTGKTQISKDEFVGQFKDHWEMALMDYSGTPEDADSEVEVSLFDSLRLIDNRDLALAWPLLKHEKQNWNSRQAQYDYMVSNRNSEFACPPVSVNLDDTKRIILNLEYLA